jgi:isohexenylglutaconyl-CoA hydratase
MTQPAKTEYIELEREQEWLTIWLNRPEARNALSAGMIDELEAALEAARADRRLRGITLRGRGGIFCAGGDLKGFKAVFHGENGTPEDVMAANRVAGELFDRINRMPQVMLMLVEGAAIAGGLGILCAADYVVVTRAARFALTETTLGIPPAQIAPFVARRIGLPAARRIMLTAARFDGMTAGELGLADEVVDDAEALEAAEQRVRSQVRQCAPGANAATKEILLASEDLDPGAVRQFAAERFAACMLGDEGREGIAAFIEKRKPKWTT